MLHALRTPRRDGLDGRHELRRWYQTRGLAELVIITGIDGRTLSSLIDGELVPDRQLRRVLENALGIPSGAWGRLP